MVEPRANSKLADLYDQLKSGNLSRRDFTTRAMALGVGGGLLSFLLRANDVAAGRLRSAGGFAVVAAQDVPTGAPEGGMEGVTRGEGGELRLIQWQAPTQLSPHVSTGTKDFLAASLVFEPLMGYLPDSSLIPQLATQVPTIENGLLAEDLTSVTFTLPEGVLWSDGEPLTAEDIQFTWQWVVDPANVSVSATVWGQIENIEVVDPLTATVTFAAPNANWFEPFTGDTWGAIYPKHVLGSGPDAHADFVNNPIGNGPYIVTSFAPNDQVVYAINENYRQPNKPYFGTVNLKGGGDAVSAARAVLQTGDYDFAWNLQVESAILRQLEEGGAGTLAVAPSTSLERVHFNMSDPNTEVDGQRSELNTPHPFLTDPAVRQALNLAADRAAISNNFYQGEEFEPPTANVLNGIAAMASPNTSWEFNLEAAAAVLDEAGWVPNADGVRAKDGVELRMNYATSINEVRQKTQQVLKASFEELGFRVQLLQIDSGIYFDGSAGNEQNISHFYFDSMMWTNNATSPFPVAYFTNWYAGPDNENVAQASNQWSGQNYQRYINPAFDELFEGVQLETDLEAAAQMFIEMNDILVNDNIMIPLVNRGTVYAISNTLNHDNVALGPFQNDYWNIANWVRLPE